MTQAQRTPKLEDMTVGRKLKSVTYHGKQYKAVVVEAEDGRHELQVGSKRFKSLSAAGSSITGAACRGGVFWGLISLPKVTKKAEATPTADAPEAEPPTAEAEEPKAEAATPEQTKAAKPKSSARAKAKRNGEAEAEKAT